MSFPPLPGTLWMEDPPRQVSILLERRWLARTERGNGAAGPADPMVRWTVADHLVRGDRRNRVDVRWMRSEAGGSLVNRAGRIRVSQQTPRAAVELVPGALEDPAGLEALVDAALAAGLAWRGECFLHAAAVEFGGRRLLVLGGSGAGKSTLAAAVLTARGRVVSDDSVILGSHQGQPLARASRRDLWLRTGSALLARRLQAIGLQATPTADDRLRLERARAPARFIDSLRPNGLCVLERAGDEDGVFATPLDQGAALAALLRGTSALYLTEAGFEELRHRISRLLSSFAQGLAISRIRVGRRLLRQPEESIAALDRVLP